MVLGNTGGLPPLVRLIPAVHLPTPRTVAPFRAIGRDVVVGERVGVPAVVGQFLATVGADYSVVDFVTAVPASVLRVALSAGI